MAFDALDQPGVGAGFGGGSYAGDDKRVHLVDQPLLAGASQEDATIAFDWPAAIA